MSAKKWNATGRWVYTWRKFKDGRTPPPFTGKGVCLVDEDIATEVRVLWENGVDTTESCQGGDDHSFPDPTIRFRGDYAEGFRALALAIGHGLKVSELRRVWRLEGAEPTGPEWEMTFYDKPCTRLRVDRMLARRRKERPK